MKDSNANAHKSKLEAILDEAERLPAIPGVVGQVLKLIADPQFSMKELVDLVRMDPGITAHILRLCNSTYYGMRQEVSSLDHAVAIIGVNALVDLVLGSGLISVLGGSSGQQGYMLARGQLWRHSMATAIVSQQLLEYMGKPKDPTLFTACLLHDVGKLVLSQFVQEYFYEMESMVLERRMSFVQAERQVLGIDHAALGGIMAEKWNFPVEIMSMIAWHHHPESAPEPKVNCYLAALSNVLSNNAGVGGGVTDIEAHQPPEGTTEVLSLSAKDLANLHQLSITWLGKANEILSLAD